MVVSGDLGHFFEFGLFAVLVALARERAVAGSTGLLLGAAAGIGYGLAIELIQWPIPYRSADPRDFAVDVVGVTCALAVLWYLRRRRGGAGDRDTVGAAVPKAEEAER